MFVMRAAVFLFALCLPFVTRAMPLSRAAHRDLGVPWQVYRARLHAMTAGDLTAIPGSPEERAVAYPQAHLGAAPAWGSLAILNSAFQSFRDQRFLVDAAMPGFLRRITWLYPDDGCYARAGLMVRQALQLHLPAPGKLFVFGDLTARSPNIAGGLVGWWYHVAPVVEVDGQKWILDPSIEPRAPLKFEDWLQRISPQPAAVQVALCASGSYSPADPCDAVSDGVEASAQIDDVQFLHDEWSRLLSLGRLPERELGAQPPWLKSPMAGL